MKKVVVQINNITAYDQFLALPPVFIKAGTEYRIIRTRDDVHQRDTLRMGDDLQFAHDLRFVNVWNQPQMPFYDFHTATVNIHRLAKGEQMERLARITKEMELAKFYWLGFNVIDFSDYKITQYIDPQWDGYVVKPTGGARSMGIMYVNQPINFKSFITEVNRIRNATSTNKDYYDLCKKYRVKFDAGKENRENEATLTLQENTLMIQEMNPFRGVREFRAIVGASTPLLIQRTHFDNPQDKTIMDVVITDENATEFFSLGLYEEIMYFLRTSNLLPHGSIDIWYSKEEDRWGIYEYQNQFGHVYIPEPLLTNYLKDVIVYQHKVIVENAL